MGGRGSRRSLQLSDRVAGLARVQANLAKTQQPDQAQAPSQPRPKSRATPATLIAQFGSAEASLSRPQDGPMGGRGSRRSLQLRNRVAGLARIRARTFGNPQRIARRQNQNPTTLALIFARSIVKTVVGTITPYRFVGAWHKYVVGKQKRGAGLFFKQNCDFRRVNLLPQVRAGLPTRLWHTD